MLQRLPLQRIKPNHSNVLIDQYRDNELSIRENRARNIRRKRLGAILEDDDEDEELREVIFEAKTSSLRRSVRKKINKKEEVELVNFSKEKRDSVTTESKLLVRI